MYSLLMVDDEPVIVEGLYHNVQWEESGFSDVYKAYSADEALSILSRHRVDIVIADISMPGLNGIDLCKRILTDWPLSKVIFLSGYRDFDFARRAVELGAYQYLVKPVRYEDIQATVEGALDQFKRDLEQKNLLEEVKARAGELREMARDRLLGDWLIHGALNTAADAEDLAGADIRLSGGMHGFELLLRLHGASGPMMQLGAQALAERMLPGYAGSYGLPIRRDRLLLAFMSEDREASEALRRRCLSCLDMLQTAVEKSLGCPLSAFVSDVAAVDKMSSLFGHMRDEMDRAPAEPQLMAVSVAAPAALDLAALNEAIATLNAPGAIGWMERATAHRQGALCRLAAAELIHALMGDAVGRGLTASKLEEVCPELFSPHAFSLSPDALRLAGARSIDAYIALVHDRRLSQRAALVAAVRQRVDERMEQGITVAELAEAFSYNASYLSQLIRQETGQSLGDMMISMRIERACALLSRGARVQDAALAAGYDNLAHFSRLFKKKMGVPPRAFADRA